ncbi:MAG: PEP-CTERM sorting domain-containing protein [Planctomycetia bacterium]|nr:PEP-CTERM sorting domain-containing protein [Planctomycetia bacterium]
MAKTPTTRWLWLTSAACLAIIASGPPDLAAKTIYLGANFDVFASNPINVGNALEAFTLTAVGKNGAVPNTFDSSNSGAGGTGITSVGNALDQVWEFDAVPTPTSNVFSPGTFPQQIDTHFLVDSTAIVSFVPPQENRITPNPSEHPFAGFGNALWGVFSLPSQSATSWDFAYIVAPLGATIGFDFQLAAPGFSAESIAASWTLNFATGDVNYDGIVDISDVQVVASNWLLFTRTGDANSDGFVDVSDIQMIGAHWLQTGGGGGEPVPEPSGLALLGIACAAGVACGRRGTMRMRRNGTRNRRS